MLKMLAFILPTNDVIGNIIILDFLHWEFIIGSLSWQLWKRFPGGDQTHSPLGTSRNRLRWHGLCHKGVAELEQQMEQHQVRVMGSYWNSKVYLSFIWHSWPTGLEFDILTITTLCSGVLPLELLRIKWAGLHGHTLCTVTHLVGFVDLCSWFVEDHVQLLSCVVVNDVQQAGDWRADLWYQHHLRGNEKNLPLWKHVGKM